MKSTLNKIFFLFYREMGKLLFDKNLNNSSKEAKHLLLINWHGKIGDAIVSSFVFKEIKEKTNIQISIITTKELKPIYQYYNSDNIYIINKSHNLFDINNIGNKIKKVDIVIPLIGTLGFNDLFLIHKLKPMCVFATDRNLKLSNRQFLNEVDKKSINDIYYKILEFMDISNIDDTYVIPYLRAIKKRVDYDILFNPFGSRIDKSLSINKSISLLLSINKTYPNLKVVVLFSPNSKVIAQEIVKKTNSINVSLAKNIFSITDSINLINKSEIIISVDTSIVHISIGLSKKVIAIYYRADNSFNVWLPKKNLITKIIFSSGDNNNYKQKNMNNFLNEKVIKQIKSLKVLDNGYT